MAGTLYVVATPLGNLEDISSRAIRVLKEVSLIAAEDTRHSRKLLSHFGIQTAMTSYFDHAEQRKAPQLVRRLRDGQDIALISDAGTPGIADPGYRLIRAAIESGIRVVPIPGPSAVIAALSVAGLPADRFVFAGFVPARAAARRAFYTALGGERRTVVCLEVGRRLPASLGDLAETMGSRYVVVAREMTKLFEEFKRGEADDVRARLGGQPVRGEVTLVIAPAPATPAPESEAEVSAALLELRDQGLSLKDSARRLAKERGWSRRELYRVGLELRRKCGDSGSAG